MEFMKQFTKPFDLESVLEQSQKTSTTVLGYVPHEGLRKSLTTLATAQHDFVRSQAASAKKLGEAVQSSLKAFA